MHDNDCRSDFKLWACAAAAYAHGAYQAVYKEEPQLDAIAKRARLSPIWQTGPDILAEAMKRNVNPAFIKEVRSMLMMASS